ncbi:MAG: LacI family DNA-binding transcriptional regulator [Beutenbergiaceae bacterium]
MAGPVTLSDVARAAGVSLATASRAINGSANRTVRPELRTRVLAAAARLRYTPDANAQAMARGRTTTLGLIVHDISDPYFSAIAAGVTATAEHHGLVVTLTATQHEAQREQQFIEVLQSQRARAIVIAGGRYDDNTSLASISQALASYRAAGGTAALIGQPLLNINTVAIDNRQGASDLAYAMSDLGYRRFGIIGGPPTHLTARDRRAGFQQALTALGHRLEGPVVDSAFTRDGGYQGMLALLHQAPHADMVFAVNDVMAVGAMAAARDSGRRVGHDIAIAGFDDIATLRDVSPPMTTVHLPLSELGRRVTELALAEPTPEPTVVQIRGKVILRDSTPARSPGHPE